MTTEDGSQTFISEQFGERYHSIHGARTESQVVFLDAGLFYKKDQASVSILEMGFGTGLNAFMTWIEADKYHWKIEYCGYEKYPLKSDHYRQLHYGRLFENEAAFRCLHDCDWNQKNDLSSNFQFLKKNTDIFELDSENKFDVVYFDAFAPNCQEELWSVELFEKIYRSMKHEGVLVTYCAKGQVKRNLRAAGFTIESLPGPPGKREMTRAHKNI